MSSQDLVHNEGFQERVCRDCFSFGITLVVGYVWPISTHFDTHRTQHLPGEREDILKRSINTKCATTMSHHMAQTSTEKTIELHNTRTNRDQNKYHALVRYTTSHTRTDPPSEPVTIMTSFGVAPLSLMLLLRLLL